MFRRCFMVGSALLLMMIIACHDTVDPLADVEDTSDSGYQFVGGILSSISTSDQVPSEVIASGADPAFNTAPSISETWTDIAFTPGRLDGISRLKFWGTNGEQDVTLNLVLDNQVIRTRSTTGERAELIPFIYEFTTNLGFTVAGDCGYTGELFSEYRAWHKFFATAPFFQWFEWGLETAESNRFDGQEPCEGTGGGEPTGGGGEPGEGGGCEICQEWLYFVNGELVDQWWDCDEAPPEVCEEGEVV